MHSTSTRIVARGPKAKGPIRQAGLREQWCPNSKSSTEVLDHLLDQGVDGVRIGVQLHGATTEWEPDTDICDALTGAGAHVVKVPVYRWEPPADSRQLDNLIGMAVNGELDAVSFTSAPAVASVLERAKALRRA